ncbi:hypothetical protein MAP00_006614 [Monascus purpureus]|nr:hypothetical protein MAP00_006614 [Monascus purpureus]
MSVAKDLVDEAKRLASQFVYPAESVRRDVAEFMQEMEDGLLEEGTTLGQIPTFITSVPDGSEKGLYLAVDLGGTNFRVCSVDLHGDGTFSMTQSKIMIPREQMCGGTAKELFLFLARQIEAFLRIHHNEHFEAHLRRRSRGDAIQNAFDLGFTFSFPVHQLSVNSGTLIRWTKGFDLPDAVGKDVCSLLQTAIDELDLPVRVAALVNDTVGTLMARSYTSAGKKGALIGAIFGTGTNGAYVEDLKRVKKLDSMDGADWDKQCTKMVINTEWGSFDNHLKVLPNTTFDQQLDAASINPGYQMFEKRVSGMFLGEILRLVLLSMHNDPSVNLFRPNEVSGVFIPQDSGLYRQWGIDTSFLSSVEADTSSDLHYVKTVMKEHLKIENPSTAECEAVRIIAGAIARRAARLSAVPLAAILISTGSMNNGAVDIGVDGSLVEYYPNFEGILREALREVSQIGPEGEKKVEIGISKDGSGVGAALIALVARRRTAQRMRIGEQ